VWIILSSLVEPWHRLRRHLSLPRSLIGMTIAHIGLGIAVLALTTVQSFTVERDVALAVGQSAEVGGYTLRFEGVKPVEGPNFEGVGGTFAVSRRGRPVAVMSPQKRQFWVQHQVTSETAIRVDRGNNLLLALGEDLGAGRWSVRVQVRPLVSLVWLAALVMAIGAAIAASDRRYRVRSTATAPAAAAERA
jgi:cytochrome c-type biogenesis protein CcmF